VRFAYSETLSGGVTPFGQTGPARPFSLALHVSGRGIRECLLGAPLAVRGDFRAEEPSPAIDAVVPARATVTGTLRFLVGSGLFYDLRIAESEHAPPRDQLELRGARRFVRGDLFTSATTFDGTLARRGAEIGEVRLRFDARDDVPRLLRSVRLG
jgi:hypothetical protein